MKSSNLYFLKREKNKTTPKFKKKTNEQALLQVCYYSRYKCDKIN